MELALLQRQLLGLIKGTRDATADDIPYIRMVAGSEHLSMVRDVVFWWRAFGASRFCVLTSALLQQLGLFDDAVSAFVRDRRVSPFIEEFGPAFLEEMAHYSEPLVRSIARFELALLKVRGGDLQEYVVEWDHDPGPVLAAVLGCAPFDRDAMRGTYRTVISHDVADLFYSEAVP